MVESFRLIKPKTTTTSVVFSSPHSGARYTQDFISQTELTLLQLRSSEDAFVDDLFATAPSLGAPLLSALFPRAFVDLNRAQEDLDGALIWGVKNNTPNSRISSGLGVIPRVVAGGRQIYHGKISKPEAMHRLNTVWAPYHSQLQNLLDAAWRGFGSAILVDCHSMPHEAVKTTGAGRMKAPQVVIGDRFGASAHSTIVNHIADVFLDAGFNVARNTPFAGAYIAQNYGRPSRGQHALQIEIDRSLYMDETTLKPHSGFGEIVERLNPIIRDITDIGRVSTSLAAE